MPNYSKGEVILIRYPFSDLSQVKVRPAVIINARHVLHVLNASLKLWLGL
jgi:mRNA interferase MazF